MQQYSSIEYNKIRVEILKILCRDPLNNFIYHRLDKNESGLCYKVYQDDLVFLHWVISAPLIEDLTRNMLTEGTIQKEMNDREFEIQKVLGTCNVKRFFLNV